MHLVDPMSIVIFLIEKADQDDLASDGHDYIIGRVGCQKYQIMV